MKLAQKAKVKEIKTIKWSNTLQDFRLPLRCGQDLRSSDPRHCL